MDVTKYLLTVMAKRRLGRGQDGKKQSRRPDLTAMKLLRSENTELPSTKVRRTTAHLT